MSDDKPRLPLVYVPQYCVQGERIPFYILWDQGLKIQITITLPDGITLSRVHNINSANLKIHNNLCTINNTEIGSYAGGVFQSAMDDQASVTRNIKFEIQHRDTKQIVNKKIELFRADVKINAIAKTINIRSNKSGRPIVKDHVSLSNYGKGTAILTVEILKDGDVKEGDPHGFEEFKTHFLKDLDDAFLELKQKFPQYDEMLQLFLSILKNPLSLNIKRATVRKTIDALDQAFNNNEQFVAAFTRCVATAYWKNISIITNADAFLAFLRSSGKNKLLIINAMKTIKVQPEEQILKLKLVVTDLVSNKYPVKKLQPIKIVSDGSYDIPIYEIINSVEVN